jgi:hypothetical protein
MTNAGKNASRLEVILEMLSQKINEAKQHMLDNPAPDGEKNLAVLTAPEWFFMKPEQPFSEIDKRTIITKVRALSANVPDMVIIPGSILWSGLNGAGNKMIKNTAISVMNGNLLHEVDKYSEGLDIKPYVARVQSESDPNRTIADTKDLTRKENQWKGGGGIVSTDKDTSQVQNNTQSSMFNVGAVTFSVEICADYNNKRAKQELAAKNMDVASEGVHVQVIVSAGAPPNENNRSSRKDGLNITNDASADLRGLYNDGFDNAKNRKGRSQGSDGDLFVGNQKLPAQGKMKGSQSENSAPLQLKSNENNTGLPDNLKSGVENLSGLSLNDVNVHYNSEKPAQLNAHAYAQGTDIHVASGQEKHLPHEAWHVVQQKQGRVQPTKQMKDKVPVNDDEGLEKEADVMGAKSLNFNLDNSSTNPIPVQPKIKSNENPIQRFPTDEQWITDSDLKKGFKNKKTRDRSDTLQQVDQKVFAYNKLVWDDNKDYEGRKQLLIDIESLIILWKNSKGDRPQEGHKPSEDKKRWPALSKLRGEATTESQLVQQLINDVGQREKERLEQERDDLIASIFDEEIRGIKDKGARADRIFTDYMAHFKGKADYTLKTVAGNNIYSGGAKIACATISAGLRDAFRFFDLTSNVIQIPARYFITKKIGPSFMDSNAVGNVKRPNGDYVDEKRFFFTGHWIVEVNGNKYFDPTSGIPVGAEGAEIIDPKYTNLISKAPNYEKGDTIKLTTLIDAAPSGSGYLLEET